MDRPLTQDRQDGGAENTRPSLPPNPRPSTSLAQPLQDGGQPAEQQLAERIVNLHPYLQASILLPVCIQLRTPWMSRILRTSCLSTPTFDNHLSPTIGRRLHLLPSRTVSMWTLLLSYPCPPFSPILSVPNLP